MPATHIQSTTQQFLDIFDITNDLLIMKDGSTSLILTVNAINFGLFAEPEQDAVIYSYAGLLNSLNYSIQIILKSQTKDVTTYLQLLKEQEEASADPKKRERISRYRAFVGELIHEGNVLDKKFYVAIPANSLEMGLLPPQTVVPGVKKIDISSVERSIILEKARNILEPKRDHLVSQFARIGLQARQLNTQEIIQLFYTSYNPEAAEGQQVTDTSSYTTTVVNAQVQTNMLQQMPSPIPAPATVPITPGVLTMAPVTTQATPVGVPAPTDSSVANPLPAAPVPTPSVAESAAVPAPDQAAIDSALQELTTTPAPSATTPTGLPTPAVVLPDVPAAPATPAPTGMVPPAQLPEI